MINVKSKNFLIFLLLAALVLAGIWYFLLKNKGFELISPDISRLNTQSQSDEVSAIEKDLDNTDFADLDAELADIEAELNAP
ncbi:hypothetical protein HYT60_00545 [Candidatus Woesebacteria bacterium]|nr:hypothetical protein [Candidatus Woesebacteria bacterium]